MTESASHLVNDDANYPPDFGPGARSGPINTPFYSQLHSISHAPPHRNFMQGPPLESYGGQPSPHRLDMSSMAVALPDGIHSSPYRDFTQAQTFAGRGLNQSPIMLGFEQPQIGEHHPMNYLQQPYLHGNALVQPQRLVQPPPPITPHSPYGAFPPLYSPRHLAQEYSVACMPPPFIAPYGRQEVLHQTHIHHVQTAGLSSFIQGQTASIELASIGRGPGPVIEGVQLPDCIPEITSDVVIASSSPSNALPESPNKAHSTNSHTAPLMVPEKYFIVKSLTLQDLDASVQNGVWATQSHNEAVLNKAYEAAGNVYLIFSANKSGEYFGYARMMSPITGESVLTKPIPQVEPEESSDGPTSVPTPATEWAPKGRIVDDSARGTIFWEAEAQGACDEAEENQGHAPKHVSRARDTSSERHGQEWGKLFKIEWLSTNRLPFYRTRGLRNPWNANREVKIARDGTELEPSVGKRLVQMFHRPVAPVTMPQGIVMVQPMMPPHY
ncbi:hypothetical protein MBLNU459_g8369t1 [Dothideomycetes sp. NU459]